MYVRNIVPALVVLCQFPNSSLCKNLQLAERVLTQVGIGTVHFLIIRCRRLAFLYYREYTHYIRRYFRASGAQGVAFGNKEES